MDSDAKEALVFALMAYLCIHGMFGNLPSCTGARGERVLGKIVPGKNFSSVFLKQHQQQQRNN
jgi:anhydro-N-acetylmuramic acid kinase